MAIETAVAAIIADIVARMTVIKSVNKMAMALETIVEEGNWWGEYWIDH